MATDPDKVDVSEEGEQLSAYDLLSKPTLELTDAEVEIIVVEMRKRRHVFLSTKKPDAPAKEKVAKEKVTDDQKKQNNAILLAQLKIPGLGA